MKPLPYLQLKENVVEEFGIYTFNFLIESGLLIEVPKCITIHESGKDIVSESGYLFRKYELFKDWVFAQKQDAYDAGCNEGYQKGASDIFNQML